MQRQATRSSRNSSGVLGLLAAKTHCPALFQPCGVIGRILDTASYSRRNEAVTRHFGCFRVWTEIETERMIGLNLLSEAP